MRWSWKLGSVASIGIYVHWTFLLVIGWIVMMRWTEGATAAGVLESVVFVLAIFGCVVLHELGHALAAKHYGIRTRDITLLPIGGLARLERMPEEPIQEFWVALAGPAVNVLIAAVLLVFLLAAAGATAFDVSSLEGAGFLVQLLAVNIFLVLFNMLPAFPMDGGRVLRAVIAHFSGDYVGATQVAASIGQVMAILFGIAGLFVLHNPFLIFIALFVYLGAQEEAHMVEMRSAFRGVPVRDAMMTRFRALQPDDTLEVATSELLAGAQQDFPVVEGGRVVGLLPRLNVLKALAEGGTDGRVRDHMQADCGTVEDTEMLDATLRRMNEGSCPTLPVVHAGQLVGLVTLENVGELMMIHSALKQRKPRPAARGSADRA
ncbi:MAG: site-2 protease family protein [Planctomycetia bacterium]|nr:site-2 protease family protein [Planctomycetia bacterium]